VDRRQPGQLRGGRIGPVRAIDAARRTPQPDAETIDARRSAAGHLLARSIAVGPGDPLSTRPRSWPRCRAVPRSTRRARSAGAPPAASTPSRPRAAGHQIVGAYRAVASRFRAATAEARKRPDAGEMVEDSVASRSVISSGPGHNQPGRRAGNQAAPSLSRHTTVRPDRRRNLAARPPRRHRCSRSSRCSGRGDFTGRRRHWVPGPGGGYAVAHPPPAGPQEVAGPVAPPSPGRSSRRCLE